MCAIVDANVRHEVFGESQSQAGKFFLDWLLQGSNRAKLAVGGKLWEELNSHRRFQLVFADLLRRSKVMRCDEAAINAEITPVSEICRSDDAHILALARVSGARLLYSNDRDLQRDFRNSRIINAPRGRVYTTARGSGITQSHRDLLRRTDLCVA